MENQNTYFDENFTDITSRNMSTYTRYESYKIGAFLVKSFCEVNGIATPNIICAECKPKGYRGNVRGWWSPRKANSIYVIPDLSTIAAKTPGYKWSYTGYFSDLTCAGVIAHETGHYLMNLLNIRNVDRFAENPVTSYEPNEQERFAEMIKLFITNPSLLKERRPKRYDYLTKNIGLKPTHEHHWEWVLRNAHPKFITVARRR